MNGHWFGGLAVGVGVGWLNATMLGIPGWANILLIGVLALIGGLMQSGGVR